MEWDNSRFLYPTWLKSGVQTKCYPSMIQPLRAYTNEVL